MLYNLQPKQNGMSVIIYYDIHNLCVITSEVGNFIFCMVSTGIWMSLRTVTKCHRATIDLCSNGIEAGKTRSFYRAFCSVCSTCSVCLLSSQCTENLTFYTMTNMCDHDCIYFNVEQIFLSRGRTYVYSNISYSGMIRLCAARNI